MLEMLEENTTVWKLLIHEQDDQEFRTTSRTFLLNAVYVTPQSSEEASFAN